MTSSVICGGMVVALLLGGCYEPDFVPGLKCREASKVCPPDQHCVNGDCLYGDGMSSPFGDCSLLTNAGCDVDEKCALTKYPDPVSICSKAGNLAEGDLCAYGRLDECQDGLVCFTGLCRRVCDTLASRDVCAGNECISLGAFALCVDSCDPLAQDCPTFGATEQNCYLDRQGSFCINSATGGGTGSVCERPTDCARGNTCYENVCRPYCDYSAAPDQQGTCSAGQLCRLAFPESSSVGVCAR